MQTHAVEGYYCTHLSTLFVSKNSCFILLCSRSKQNQHMLSIQEEFSNHLRIIIVDEFVELVKLLLMSYLSREKLIAVMITKVIDYSYNYYSL